MTKEKTGSGGTVAVYITFLAVIIAAVAFAGRFVLFRPWTVRTHTCAVEMNEKIYLFGGRHRTGIPMDDILCADFAEGTLKRAGKLPEALMSVSGASDGRLIYLTGGYNGKNYIGTVYSYDPETEICEPFTELPYPCIFGSLTSDGKNLYHSGGWDGVEVRKEILKVSLQTGAVTEAALLPVPLQYAGTGIIDSTLFIIGGEDADGTVRREIYSLDLSVGSLDLAGTLPAPLCRSSSAILDGAVYLTGGWGGGVSDAIQYLRPQPNGSLVILKAGRLPEPGADMASEAQGGFLYIFGGTEPKAKRQIRILRYNPASGETEDMILKSFAWW